LSPGRRAPVAERDRIRSRDGKTLGRRLRNAQSQVHRGSARRVAGGTLGKRETGNGKRGCTVVSRFPCPVSRLSQARSPPRDRCAVLRRVRCPARERPRLLLALRRLARVRRALLSFLWSARSRLRVTSFTF